MNVKPGDKIAVDGDVQIVLEVHYDPEGRYLGRTVIYASQLTPQKLNSIKGDLADVQGFKAYHEALKKAGYDLEA